MDQRVSMSQVSGVDLNDFASRRNPIIGPSRGDTLFQAACVASFLGRYHSDQADWKNHGEKSEACGPDSLSGNEERGLSLICESLAAALWFELEGRG